MKDQLPVLSWRTLLERVAKPGTTVLEIGAGEGGDSLIMQNELGARVTAVDNQPDRVVAAKLRGVRALLADMRCLKQHPQLRTKQFDTVFSANCLHSAINNKQARQTLQEMRDRTKPGGRIVICTDNFGSEHPYREIPQTLTPQGLRILTTSLGLEVESEEVVSIPEKPWAAPGLGYLVIEARKRGISKKGKR